MGVMQFFSRFLADGAVKNQHFSALEGDRLDVAKIRLSNGSYSAVDMNALLEPLHTQRFILMVQATVPSTGTGSSITGTALNDIINAAAFYDQVSAVETGSKGVVVDPPYNKVQIRKSSDGQPLEGQVGGPDVFGRLTFDGTDYTLSFVYGADGGGEPTFTMPADISIDILFPESYALADIPVSAFVNGVSFVDGLPASHHHTLSELDMTDSGIDASHVVTFAVDGLGAPLDVQNNIAKKADASTSGASLIGFFPDSGNALISSAGSVQEALDALAAEALDLETAGAASGAFKIAFVPEDGNAFLTGAADVQTAVNFMATRLASVENGAQLVGYQPPVSGEGSVLMAGTASVKATIDKLAAEAEDMRADIAAGSGLPSPKFNQPVTGTIDGTNDTFVVVSDTGYVSGSLAVFVQGQRQMRTTVDNQAAGQYYEADPGTGEFKFCSDAKPQSGEVISVDFLKPTTAEQPAKPVFATLTVTVEYTGNYTATGAENVLLNGVNYETFSDGLVPQHITLANVPAGTYTVTIDNMAHAVQAISIDTVPTDQLVVSGDAAITILIDAGMM